MIEAKELKIAKEVDDVLIAMAELVKVIKNKGDYSSLMDEFVAAVSGVDQIDDELKEDFYAVVSTIGYRAGDIAKAFKKEDAA